MHELSDPALLAQCSRIKEMIEKISTNPVYKEGYYASRYHQWKLSPPVQMWEIEEFEKKANIELPEEYVYYLTQVGRGGASPGTAFDDFPDFNGYELDRVAETSEILSKILSEKDWKALYKEHCGLWESGVICLCDMDLTFEAFLIVTGPNRGRIVYLDYDGECAPIWPKNSPNFLSWCENFYTELLAGYDIKPTWKFMWQEPGDERALIRAFQSAKDKEYQKEVLYSFCKFKNLSQEAYQFLEQARKSGFRKEVEKILNEFA